MILLDPHARPVIGHRGDRAHAPENTLESLRQAVALGVDAVEFDLRVTREGTLVLMHDETLDRTTNGPRRPCDRRVSPPSAGRVTRTSKRRCTSRTGQVEGVLMRWPDSAEIKDSQGLFMAVE